MVKDFRFLTKKILIVLRLFFQAGKQRLQLPFCRINIESFYLLVLVSLLVKNMRTPRLDFCIMDKILSNIYLPFLGAPLPLPARLLREFFN